MILNCQDGLNADDIINEVNEKAEPVSTVVFMGASIMNSAFDTQLDVLRVAAKYGFKDVSFVDECIPGNTSGDLLVRLPAVLSSYSGQKGVVFVYSIGGNDAGVLRPYSTATESEIATMSSNIQDISDLIFEGGHRAIYANITYRTYGGSIVDESEGTLPFNENIVHPIIRTKFNELWLSEDKIPFVDLYNFIKNNQNLLQADGIHLTQEGEEAFREYWFGRLKKLISVRAKKFQPPSGAKILIDFNNEGTYQQSNERIISSGEYSFNGPSVENIIGVNVSVYNRNGLNNSGRGNGSDTSTSLLNNALLRSSVYTTNLPMYVYIQNISSGSTGTISLTCSRSTTEGDRVGNYTVNGVTKIMDAELLTPPITSFPFVVDEFGRIEIVIDREAGSTFAYLNGAEVIFD